MEKLYGNVDEELKIIENEKKSLNNKNIQQHIGLFNNQNINTHVVFPVQGAILDLAQERIECMIAHLFGASKEDYKTNPTLKSCMSCEDCTFNKSAVKAYSRILNEIITIYHNTLENFVNAQFTIFENCFTYEIFEPSQILAKMILNYKLINSKLDITQLFQSVEYKSYLEYDKICNKKLETYNQSKSSYQEEFELICDRNISMEKYEKIVGKDYYKYVDVLTLMPNIKIRDDIDVHGIDEIKDFKPIYILFKSLNFDKILTFCLMEKIFFSVEHKNKYRELHNKKQICKKLLKLYTGITYKNVKKDNLIKLSKTLFNKKIKLKDFNYFSENKREKEDTLFLDMLNKELMDEKDYDEFIKHIPQYYYLINKEYDKDEFLNSIMTRLTSKS